MNTYSVSLGLGLLQKYREVTAADADDPTDRHEGVNFRGYQAMVLEVVGLAGGDMGAAPITVQPTFWSEAAGKFVPDHGVAAVQFNAPGQWFVDNIHGRVMFPKVVDFDGGYTARISVAPAKPELAQD